MDEWFFPWVQPMTAADVPGTSHVDNIQIMSMLFDAWMSYMNQGLGIDRTEVFVNAGRPIVKSVSAQFHAEIHAGQQLTCGVRVASRSTRSFTLEQVLWSDEPSRPVATGAVVLVTIDRTSGRPVEIPTDLWDAVERAERRLIPASARVTSPR